MAVVLLTVSSKGRVTIPASILRHLQIGRDQKIALVLEPDGSVRSVRLRKPRYSSVAELSGTAGILRRKPTWPEMLTIAYDDRALDSPAEETEA